MINTTIPRRPINPIRTKNDRFGPEINIKTTNVKIITIAVPKSGSNIISKKNNRITRNNGINPFFIFFIFLLLWDRYLDVYIIKPILENSDGCIPSGPIPNQLREPFLTLPIPGIRTSINNIKHRNSKWLEYFSR